MAMQSMDVPIADLQLDAENPRLPEELHDRDPDSLIQHIANEYNTVEVARSMAEHGFFDSEPLIAIKKDRHLVVVEGNRRLTALKLLTDADLRARIELDEATQWEELADEIEIEDTVPARCEKPQGGCADYRLPPHRRHRAVGSVGQGAVRREADRGRRLELRGDRAHRR
jgi:hypothetical protein